MLDPLRDTPADVTDKLLRWGGKNEYGDPNWRIILAENHLVQRAGMWTEFDEGTEQVQFEERAHDVAFKTQQIAPTAIRIGMLWVPLYPCTGWILERWFPAHAWGSQSEWEHETAQDGVTRMMGQYPRHGDYYIVSEEFHAEQRSAEFWKGEIQKCLRAEEAMPGDPATMLSRNLYLHRWRQEQREEEYREEVNRLHRTVTDPLLATISKTAQLVRDKIRVEQGFDFHLAAG